MHVLRRSLLHTRKCAEFVTHASKTIERVRNAKGKQIPGGRVAPFNVA